MARPEVTLQRAPIHIPDTPAELLGETVPKARQDLEEKTSRVLGYKPLLQSLRALKTAGPNMEARIADLFARLGIEPFTEESVLAYQKQERDRVRTWKQKWPDVCGLILAISFLLGLAALVSAGIAWVIGKPLGWLSNSGSATAVVSCIASVALSYITDKIGDWEWRSVPIKEYTDPVPEAALKMALALKQAWPTALIEVESLSLGPRTSDPFLVFKIEEGKFKRRYHVGVWGEPNFQAEFR